jgi:hypothetical protein
VINDKYYAKEAYLNDDKQITIFFSKLQYVKINLKQGQIARNLNWR